MMRALAPSFLTLALVAAVLLIVPGCYESPKTAVHEPGMYKGATDPLLAMQRDPKQQQRLRERFDLTQRDR